MINAQPWVIDVQRAASDCQDPSSASSPQCPAAIIWYLFAWPGSFMALLCLMGQKRGPAHSAPPFINWFIIWLCSDRHNSQIWISNLTDSFKRHTATWFTCRGVTSLLGAGVQFMLDWALTFSLFHLLLQNNLHSNNFHYHADFGNHVCYPTRHPVTTWAEVQSAKHAGYIKLQLSTAVCQV